MSAPATSPEEKEAIRPLPGRFADRPGQRQDPDALDLIAADLEENALTGLDRVEIDAGGLLDNLAGLPGGAGLLDLGGFLGGDLRSLRLLLGGEHPGGAGLDVHHLGGRVPVAANDDDDALAALEGVEPGGAGLPWLQTLPGGGVLDGRLG